MIAFEQGGRLTCYHSNAQYPLSGDDSAFVHPASLLALRGTFSTLRAATHPVRHHYGTPSPPLLHCRRGGAQLRTRRGPLAHRAAAAEPTDSRSGTRDWDTALRARRAWGEPHRRWPRLPS